MTGTIYGLGVNPLEKLKNHARAVLLHFMYYDFVHS
jgi:hypothetical protein